MRLLHPALVLSATVTAAAALASPAAAATTVNVLGPVLVTPSSGDDFTLFSGQVDGQCPDSTIEAQFAVVGPGSDYLTNGEGALNPGPDSSPTGQGLTWFLYGSVSNLRTATNTMFTTDGTYGLTLYCQSATADGGIEVTDVYQTEIRYTAGSPGTWELATPDAAISGEEFFTPQILGSMGQDLSGLPLPGGEPSAEAGADDPGADEPAADQPAGAEPSQAPTAEAPAAPGAGEESAADDEAAPAVPDASQQDAAALQDSVEGSAADSGLRLWLLSAIGALVVVAGVAALVINHRRRRASAGTDGADSAALKNDEGVLVGSEASGVEGSREADRTTP
jgi:hypothetical protein